tara:strand:- start:212 stop:421 length:210 start_codon:yes stop_codon:yes gene_type:complete
MRLIFYFLLTKCLGENHKKGQATYITPLRLFALAALPPWGIQQELVVQNLPMTNISPSYDFNNHFNCLI